LLLLLVFSIGIRAQGMYEGVSLSGSGPNEYLVSTSIISALNTTVTTWNIIKLRNVDKHKSNAAFGIISGTMQTVYGAFHIPSTNKDDKLLTTVNIGLGLTTILISTIRLVRKNSPKEDNVTFNLLYLPNTKNSNSIIGVSIALGI
jgi:hypothetical protein